tara:strand:+ start:977 stop:1918 length:942 start_codon:yes stop_codon:yes gene_type:complete
MDKELNLTEILTKFKPNVKPSTINQYIVQLKQLKTIFNSDNFMFLKNVDTVVDKLKQKHFTTQRNFYNSIIVFLQAMDEDKELIKKYTVMRDDFNEHYKKTLTDRISDKQQKNFASMEEIRTMINTMDKSIKQGKLKTKADLTGKEKELLMMNMIYKMLLEIPTRNDIADMIITTPSLYAKMDKKHNYLVVGRPSVYYMLNNYKTNKTYGFDKKIDVSGPLATVIRAFLRVTKKKTGDILLTTSTGNAISRNVLSQMLIKTSQKYIGKSVSTTMMRKIVVSHELGELKQKQKDLTDKMCHSVQTQNTIYNKEA